MKLLKKINNNFALALDSQGKTIIVEGKGIGFAKMPCELDDLQKISRTYYNAGSGVEQLIKSVRPEVLSVAQSVFDYAINRLDVELSPNLPFTLADHIEFAIERVDKDLNIPMPLVYDIESLYAQELAVAKYAMDLIEKQLLVKLPEQEVIGIALNIINGEILPKKNGIKDDKAISEQIVCCIESNFKKRIDRKTFQYYRFMTHLKYLLNGEMTDYPVSFTIFTSVKNQYPEMYKLSTEITELIRKYGYSIREEEKLYLMLHLQRLYSHEDCYRKGITPSV